MVEHLYSEDSGRPAADPMVLVKMALLQHLYGIRSLRQTVMEINMNIAYRWFLHYDLDTKVPHFATVSYAFATRFPSELFEEIFAWVLEAAVERKFVEAKRVFIDATHIKASANRKKHRKVLAQHTACVYDDHDDEQKHGSGRMAKESTSDPESGLFVKSEHKMKFAYTAYVSCDEHNFVLNCEVTPGNVHDSKVFDTVYERTVEAFPDVETVAVDAGYKTPWICKTMGETCRLHTSAR